MSIKNHAEIIALWPKPHAKVFAKDIGVKWGNARQMSSTKRIPPTYWPTVLDAARERNIDLTLNVLKKTYV